MRRTQALARCALLVGALTGCSADAESDPDLGGGGGGDGGSEGDGDGEGCAGYGDGICQPDLACEAPDIDCFVVFDSDLEAQTWFAEFEALLAEQEGRPPRAVVDRFDARVVRMRELLDRGWDAYQGANAVGDLAAHAPALVVLVDESVNAFVLPDLYTDRAGFAVMVQTGLLDLGLPDAEMLGMVMHELEHAVGLHIVGDVRNRIRKFYVVDQDEPFGFEQEDDPFARDRGEAWRAAAAEIGMFAHSELRGLPVGPSDIDRVFRIVLGNAAGERCDGPMAALNLLFGDISDGLSTLDMSLTLSPGFGARVDAVMASLRDDCLPDLGKEFIDIVAELGGLTREEVEKSLTIEDLVLVRDKHALDAIAAMVTDRRSKMRDSEGLFEIETGRPWTALRYYSIEEAADDATIPVLAGAELPLHGLGDFMFSMLADLQAPCREILDAGATPPYGADLADEHHASCWRVDHNARLAESGVLVAPPSDNVSSPTSYRRSVRSSASARKRLPMPPRYSDLVMY